MATSTTSQPAPQQATPDPGVEGNERLTGITGALLLVPLAVEGITILRIGQLISLHMFLGLVLLAPIGLKLASTGYRFLGYYTGRTAYRRKGPPPMPLRILGVGVVPSTIVMMASGVALMLVGPGSRDPLLLIHKVSFIVWIALTSVHVLAHLGGSYSAIEAEYRPGYRNEVRIAGATKRAVLILTVVLAGVILALVAIPEFGAWQHGIGHHHRG
jgi:hypothetical protein